VHLVSSTTAWSGAAKSPAAEVSLLTATPTAVGAAALSSRIRRHLPAVVPRAVVSLEIRRKPAALPSALASALQIRWKLPPMLRTSALIRLGGVGPVLLQSLQFPVGQVELIEPVLTQIHPRIVRAARRFLRTARLSLGTAHVRTGLADIRRNRLLQPRLQIRQTLGQLGMIRDKLLQPLVGKLPGEVPLKRLGATVHEPVVGLGMLALHRFQPAPKSLPPLIVQTLVERAVMRFDVLLKPIAPRQLPPNDSLIGFRIPLPQHSHPLPKPGDQRRSLPLITLGVILSELPHVLEPLRHGSLLGRLGLLFMTFLDLRLA